MAVFMGIAASASANPICNDAPLFIPPPDYSVDGAVFLASGDVNRDGVLDLSDVNLFVADFLAGCPRTDSVHL